MSDPITRYYYMPCIHFFLHCMAPEYSAYTGGSRFHTFCCLHQISADIKYPVLLLHILHLRISLRPAGIYICCPSPCLWLFSNHLQPSLKRYSHTLQYYNSCNILHIPYMFRKSKHCFHSYPVPDVPWLPLKKDLLRSLFPVPQMSGHKSCHFLQLYSP